MMKKLFRVLFACAIIGSGLISLGSKGSDPMWELPADLFFTCVVFCAIFLSVRNGSNRNNQNRMFAVGWLVIFALFQTLHLIHHNQNYDYFLTSKMVDIAYLLMLKSVWTHHLELGLWESERKSRGLRYWLFDSVNLGLILLLFPLIFGVSDLAQMLSTDQVKLVLSGLLLYDIVLSGILVVFVLKNRLSLIHFTIVILLLVSNVMQGGMGLNVINGIISSLCLWVSYWLFFELFFDKESKMQNFFAISERDQIFSVFNDNKDAFLVLEKSKSDAFRIINMNRAASNMFNYPLSAIEKEPEKLFRYTSEEFSKLMENEESITLNQEMYCSNQERLYVDIQLQRFELRESIWYLLNIRDVRDRKESERKINTFETIFKNAAEAMLVTDADQIILWSNDEFKKLYGYSEEDLKGKTPKVIKSGAQPVSFYKKMWTLVEEKHRWQGEVVNRKKDGSLVMVFQSIVKIVDENTNSAMYISVAQDLTEKKTYEEQLFLLAYTNQHSGLYNKEYLKNVFVNDGIVGAIFVRINDLKFVRSVYGDYIGTQYLLEIIGRIKAFSDFMLFQYGEDVLLLLVQGRLIGERECETLLAELKNSLIKTVDIDRTKGTPDLTVVASDVEESVSLDTIIRKAQMTLEYALKMNVNNALIYNEGIGAFIKKQFSMTQALKRALVQREYFVVYHPILNINTGRMMGVEALLRWKSKEFGLVPPLEFIDILEANELIHEVGLFVMETAFKDYLAMKDVQIEGQLKLSLNVSPIQLTHKDFTQRVTALLETYQMPHESLIFEIVESQSFDKLSFVQENLKWIRAQGIQLAIDDFGTEYSSLTRLSQMDVQYMKLDKSFFDNIHNSVSEAVLVTGVIAMAGKMNIEIIAEGIETYEQLLFLLNQKCQYVQGFYFERPMEIQDLLLKLDRDYMPTIDLSQVSGEDYRLQLNQSLTQMKSSQSLLELGMIETDEKGNILYINQVMANWLGTMRQALIHTPIRKWIQTNDDFAEFYQENQFKEATEIQSSVFNIGGAELSMSVSTRRLEDRFGKMAKIIWYFENTENESRHKQGLLEKRDSYRKVFMYSPLPIVIWDTDYKIIDWNMEADNLFKLKDASQIFHIDHLFHANGISGLRFHAERLFRGHESVMENTNVDAMGSSHICQWHSQPVFNESGSITRIISIIEDITPRVSAEAKVKQLFRVLDQSEQLYILTDETEKILYVNQHMLEAFQLGQFDTKSLDDLQLLFINEDNSLRSGFSDIFETWHGFCVKDTLSKTVYKCYREVVKDETTDQLLIIYSLQDESRQMEHSLEIEEMKKLFANQERLATIGHLAAGVAHEINNPLSYMLTNNSYLMEMKPDYERALETQPMLKDDLFEIIDSFDEGLKHIKNIVSDLKGFVRATPEEKKVVTQLNELIPKVVNVAHNEIKYTSVVQLNLEANLPEVQINPSKIQQVILNLILNAGQAIAAQKKGAMGEIQINTYSETETVLLEIKDNGGGMPAEVLNRIFEPFFTTKPEGVGTGLGLSISKEIIEGYHGGQMTVQSVVGQGTVFQIRLPVEDQMQDEDELSQF